MPLAFAVSAMCLTLAWNMSRSTTMQGVGNMSLVMPVKLRLAMRASSSLTG